MRTHRSSRRWEALWLGDSQERRFKEDLRFDLGATKIGQVLVAMGEHGIVSILIGDDSGKLIENLEERFPYARLSRESLDGGDIVASVASYIDSPCGILDLPLELRGTKFQRSVWKAVREIPAGEISSYSEIASRIGRPKAVRAVGTACAMNNVAFAVPCHRVLHKDGSMSWGEGWGKERQRKLLALEALARQKSSAKAERINKKRCSMQKQGSKPGRE